MLASNDEVKTTYEVQAILEALTDEQKKVLKRMLLDCTYHPEESMDEIKIKNFYRSVKAKIDEV